MLAQYIIHRELTALLGAAERSGEDGRLEHVLLGRLCPVREQDDMRPRDVFGVEPVILLLSDA